MHGNMKPRCIMCSSQKPLDWGETICDSCKRTCPGCGKLIPYSGRGTPRLMCIKCADWRPDRRLCPCGKQVPKGRYTYCGDQCKIEAHRIRNGGKPRLGWRPDLHTIAKREGDHEKAAKKVFHWMHRNSKNAERLELKGNAIYDVYGELLWAVRATKMGFDVKGYGLPKWVPVDDEDRLTANEPQAYFLLNGRFDVCFAVSVRYREKWKRESLFVPRYNAIAEVLHCPRSEGKIRFLG